MTLPTLAAIMAGMQDVVGAVGGIRFSPDVPPEQLPGGDVWGLVYPAAGTFEEVTAGRATGSHTLHLMIATPLRNLRTDWGRVIGLGDPVARALLAAGTLGGTALHANALRYTFGSIEWGGSQLFGWRFEVDVLAAGSLT